MSTGFESTCCERLLPFQSCQQPDTFLSQRTANSNSPRGFNPHIVRGKKSSIYRLVRDPAVYLRNACATESDLAVAELQSGSKSSPRKRLILRDADRHYAPRSWNAAPALEFAPNVASRHNSVGGLLAREWAPYPCACGKNSWFCDRLRDWRLRICANDRGNLLAVPLRNGSSSSLWYVLACMFIPSRPPASAMATTTQTTSNSALISKAE